MSTDFVAATLIVAIYLGNESNEQHMGQPDTLLSEREAEVLSHLEETTNTRSIAKSLDIRISTVHTYLQRIDAKQEKAAATLEQLDSIDYDDRRAHIARENR